jgi:peptidoglycan hydrolase-like protein with peptidoglycan-binding domain
MKKSILALIFISTISGSFAATSCLDYSTNLSRGAESSLVLSLQNFLFSKGYLKVTPNGYFGPSTFSAVKAYQKANGFAQVGNTGPATRAAIKKDSCTAGGASLPTVQTPAAPVSTSSVQTTSSVVVPRPAIDSFDFVTLFAGGTANWNFSLYGNNFSTTTNTITMRNMETRKTYAIGTLPSASGTVIVMPTNLTGTAYSCGAECKEKMEAGRYEVVVTTVGGSSASKVLTILPFTMSALTTAVNTIPASATHVQIGLFSYSSPQAVLVKSISFSLGTSTISDGGINSVTLTDQFTGATIDSDTELQAIQSGIIGAYANVSNTKPGDAYGAFSITIEDYIGKKDTSFISSPVLMTVAGVL